MHGDIFCNVHRLQAVAQCQSLGAEQCGAQQQAVLCGALRNYLFISNNATLRDSHTSMACCIARAQAMPRRALGSLSVLAVWLRNACATRNTPTVPDSDCASPVETKHGGVMTCVQTYSVSRPHAFFRTAARQLFAFAYGRLTEVVAQVIGKEEH